MGVDRGVGMLPEMEYLKGKTMLKVSIEYGGGDFAHRCQHHIWLAKSYPFPWRRVKRGILKKLFYTI
jgi:hypothetical protein